MDIQRACLENINAHCLKLHRDNVKKRKVLLICVNLPRKDLSKYYSQFPLYLLYRFTKNIHTLFCYGRIIITWLIFIIQSSTQEHEEEHHSDRFITSQAGAYAHTTGGGSHAVLPNPPKKATKVCIWTF